MHYWEYEFVAALGSDPQQVAAQWIPVITSADSSAWAGGAPENWARQSFELARDHAYGKLPPPGPKGVYMLDAAYVADATDVVSMQLHKAGVRLARVLNRALAQH